MIRGKFPSLLWGEHEPAGEIAPQAFVDTKLDALLPESTLKILALPCTAPLIAARQEVFKKLCGMDSSNDSFSTQFEALGGASTSLAQAYDAYATAQNKLEELLLFRRYAQKYAEFSRLAENISGCDSDLVLGFAGYFSELSGQTSKLEQALAETSGAAARLSKATLTFSPHGTSLDCPDATEPIAGRIRRLAEELGYNIPPRRPQKEIRTEPFYSEAMLRRLPDEARELEDFLNKFKSALDPSITAYRGEIAFYLTMRDFYRRAAKAGLPFAFPSVSERPVFRLRDMYDPSLLLKNCEIVPNDAEFDERESFFFLTGANGGGKTTYLRGVSINLILALAGAPVVAKSGEVWPFSAVYTHFPADENFTGSGRLVEEAARADEILSRAKAGAFVFMNETYSGTDAERGLDLTLRAARILRDKGAMGLYVTHFHEVADYDFPMLNTVMDPTDPSRRTYRIMKSSALRSSFARDILRKYGLDPESLMRRMEVHP